MKSIKFLFVIAFMLTTAITVQAQKENISIKYNYNEEVRMFPRYQGEVSLTGDIGSFDMTSVGLETVHGVRINKYIFAGAGAGVNYMPEYQLALVPVFASVKGFYPIGERFSPFAYVDAGYEVLETSTFYTATGVGIKYRVLAFSVGWKSYGNANFFNLKFGLMF